MIMKNVVSAVAAVALLGSISVAFADTTTAPNGAGQDTSKSHAVPMASQGQNAGMRPMSADGVQQAPNENNNLKGVPDEAKQQ
jgi:hypothetical protein